VGGQKAWNYNKIAINKNNYFPLRFQNPKVASQSWATMLLTDQPHMGNFILMLLNPFAGAISGAIVHKYDFITIVLIDTFLRL
jgi:hypothetical protein